MDFDTRRPRSSRKIPPGVEGVIEIVVSGPALCRMFPTGLTCIEKMQGAPDVSPSVPTASQSVPMKRKL